VVQPVARQLDAVGIKARKEDQDDVLQTKLFELEK
jgi:hypothetical protein